MKDNKSKLPTFGTFLSQSDGSWPATLDEVRAQKYRDEEHRSGVIQIDEHNSIVSGRSCSDLLREFESAHEEAAPGESVVFSGGKFVPASKAHGWVTTITIKEDRKPVVETHWE